MFLLLHNLFKIGQVPLLRPCILQIQKLICHSFPLTWCGFCIDDELGAKSGSGTDHTCDNITCSRTFHSVCLGDWLRSITTRRQYVDFSSLFILCSKLIAV